MEFTEIYKKPKILLAAVYPAIAVEPNELTEDCNNALERLITVLWIPAGITNLKNLLQIETFDESVLKNGADNFLPNDADSEEQAHRI